MADLILINGLPGTGKTTLAAKLKNDLGLPCLGKDMLKEFFFDTIGTGGLDDSRLLGKAVSEMMYLLAQDYAEAGRSIILESAYFVEFARPAFQGIIADYPVRILEVYCSTEPSVRRERFRLRAETGNRHPGHAADALHVQYAQQDGSEPLDVYAPIGLGKLVRIDTTQFGDKEYAELVQTLKTYLEVSHD